MSGLASGARARVAVVGGGAWGTTLAIHLARRGPVVLVVRDAAHAATLEAARENAHYLPGMPFPGALAVSAEPEAVADADELLVMAVPAAAMRESARRSPPSCAMRRWCSRWPRASSRAACCA